MVIFRKYIVLVTLMTFSSIAIATMWTAQGDAAVLTTEQKQFLKKKGTIIFVSQTHYPPFEFVGSDGDHTGMCIELIRWIATEFGFKAHFTDTTFKQAQDNILSGQADVLTSFFYSKKRDQLFDFTPPLFEVPASIFIDAQRPDIKEVTDLNGKIVAMQAGDYAKEYLESQKIACKFKYTKDFAQATDLVVRGQADVIIGDEQIVLYHIFSNHLTEKIKKVGTPLYIGKNCMGFKEPGGELLAIMNTGIAMARQQGVLDQINKKWLGTTYARESLLIQKLLLFLPVLLGAVLLVSAVVWVWNLKLRQKVASRTAELAKSEKTLRTILEASPLGIGLTENRIIKWYNPALCRMLGYDSRELIGKPISRVYWNNNWLALRDRLVENLKPNDPDNFIETQWLRKDGSCFDCRVRFTTLNLDGRAMTIAIAEDITKLKQVENRIKASLKEKEMLLREIHHRVKNNMQVISSLLSLQEEKVTPENAFRAFKDSQNRIQSIALVHEILYQSNNLSEIPVKTYLDVLINYIEPIYAPINGSVNITRETEDIRLKIDHAIPLGLMVTELLTNAMKYGVMEGRLLEITVSVQKMPDHMIQVKIGDNGQGMGPDFNLDAIETLGLKLVKGLIEEQLEGHFRLAAPQEKGTCWIAEWPFFLE